jgi:phospholipase/carboxylesterase
LSLSNSGLRAFNGRMESDFIHRFQRGESKESPTLLLLHGTGGDENDLLGVGRSIAPRANLISPRGRVLENGSPRFFRRFAEGVFDEQDIRRRADELNDFIGAAAREYELDQAKVIAFGYSNGANIAGAVLMLHPSVLAGAILLRPMTPITPHGYVPLKGKPILIQSGAMDQIAPASEISRLVTLLTENGADVRVKQHHTGHGLTNDDLIDARAWLAEYFPGAVEQC